MKLDKFQLQLRGLSHLAKAGVTIDTPELRILLNELKLTLDCISADLFELESEVPSSHLPNISLITEAINRFNNTLYFMKDQKFYNFVELLIPSYMDDMAYYTYDADLTDNELESFVNKINSAKCDDIVFISEVLMQHSAKWLQYSVNK